MPLSKRFAAIFLYKIDFFKFAPKWVGNGAQTGRLKNFKVIVSNFLIFLLLVKFCCVNENHNDLSELSGSASCGATNVSQKGSVLPVLSEKLFA